MLKQDIPISVIASEIPHISEKGGNVLAEGRAVGAKIGSGVARVVKTLDDMNRVQPATY